MNAIVEALRLAQNQIAESRETLQLWDTYENAIGLANKDGWCPERCPITFRPFFMWIEHPDLGMVPTYGGPYDSYTIPEPVLPLPEAEDGDVEFEDIELACLRFDHDEGCWYTDEVEDPGKRVILADKVLEMDDMIKTLAEEVMPYGTIKADCEIVHDAFEYLKKQGLMDCANGEWCWCER